LGIVENAETSLDAIRGRYGKNAVTRTAVLNNDLEIGES